MFGKKKEKEWLTGDAFEGVDKLLKSDKEVSYAPKDILSETFRERLSESIVSCDKCKHLIYKKDAIKGESRIVKRGVYTLGYRQIIGPISAEELEKIEEVWLCPNCAPKKGKNVKT